jgi:hypothetical protein
MNKDLSSSSLGTYGFGPLDLKGHVGQHRRGSAVSLASVDSVGGLKTPPQLRDRQDSFRSSPILSGTGLPMPPTPLPEGAWVHASKGFLAKQANANAAAQGAASGQKRRRSVLGLGLDGGQGSAAGAGRGGGGGGADGAVGGGGAADDARKLDRTVPNRDKGTKARVGKVVKRGHARYQFALDLQFGIFESVKIALHEPEREPAGADFTAVWERGMMHDGTEVPAGSTADFVFRDYAGYVFRKIRDVSGIDHTQYLLSLCGDYCLSELGSPGKSGQLFYFTRDTSFIIKTVTQHEHVFLREILTEYYQHLKGHPGTLISRFLGLHMVRPRGKDKVYFVIMSNVFDSRVEIHERYDLKGSTVGRAVPDSKRLDPSVVMKDLDFEALKRKIHLGPQRKKVFMDQLEKDAVFLTRHGIMDYSLLLGIHYKSLSNAVSYEQTLSVVSPSTLEQLEAAFPPQSRKEHQRAEKELKKSKKRQRRAREEAAERERKRLRERGSPRSTDYSSSESVRGGTDVSKPVFRPTSTTEFLKVHPLAASLNDLQTTRASGVGDSLYPGGSSALGQSMSRLSLAAAAGLSGDAGGDGPGGNKTSSSGIQAIGSDGSRRDEVYYAGVIDVLQTYTWQKRGENWFKGLRYDRSQISAVPPRQYGKRFVDYIAKCIV